MRRKQERSCAYETGFITNSLAGEGGDISIEHEDPVWSGSEEKVKQGLILAKRYIESFMLCDSKNLL